MKINHNKSESNILRQKAEEILRLKPPRSGLPFSEFDMFKFIQELEVYQIELEMQNEELMNAKDQLSLAATDKYAELYDFARSGYFTLSKEGLIIELNLSGSEMLGKERSYLRKKPFVFYVSTNTKPIFTLFFENIFNNKTKETCEVTLSTKDNFPMTVHLTGIATENGEQCLVSMIDITASTHMKALHESEEKLRISQLYTRSLIEASPDPLVTINMDGKILDLNLATETATGFFRTNLIGTDFSDYFTEPDKAKTGYQRVFKDGYIVDYQLTIRHASGKLIDVLYNANVFKDEHGKILGVFAAARDITKHKQAEEEIKRKNIELQLANAEKDKFFSIIAHDLRGPFNGFLGLSKMMAEELPTLTVEQVQRMASGMRNSAANLYNLLENLLEWSRLQRGITPFEPEPFLLMSMMAESMRPVMDSANKKEIEISYEIPADLEVFADKYMLASTIRNLASNAVKFTRKGGKVTISAKPAPGHSVEISVRDTGIGMSPQMVAGLFRLDVKSNRKGTDNEPSTGLGLLLCKDFVEKHGGKIWVESEEGKQSTFRFTIPAAPSRNG